MWIAAIYLARRHMLDQPLLGAVADARREHEGLGRFMLTANADIMLGDLTGRLTPADRRYDARSGCGGPLFDRAPGDDRHFATGADFGSGGLRRARSPG